MRKSISFVLPITLAFTMVSSQGVFATDYNTWQNYETRSIYIGEGVSFEGAFNVGEEQKILSKDGREEYIKKANIRGELIKNPGDEILLSENLEVTFRYDKVSAWIADPQADIIKSNRSVSGPKWKVSNNQEVYISPEQCVVSEKSYLCKKAEWFNVRKTWDSVGSFHVDVVCSPNGEIKFNSESIGSPAADAYTLKSKASEEKLLQDNITRKMEVIDEIYPSNGESQRDKYNYIKRRIEITYSSPDKKTIAFTTMELNFRYNPKTREVDCISTSHIENAVRGRDNIEVYLRTGDKTRNHAGAYGKVNLSYQMRAITDSIEEVLFASCDYSGNIRSEIITE